MRTSWVPEDACGVAQAVSVIGDGWQLLIVRDIARGIARFDDLASDLRISRKVLAQRLDQLVANRIVAREPYQDHPPRYDYVLTPKGRALLPVLVAMQDWGDRWILADGALTATSPPDAPPAARVSGLSGAAVPPVALPSTLGGRRDIIDPDARRTVLFGYPATGIPGPLPDGWGDITGVFGCTLENRLFRAAYPRFREADVAVHGLSTQRPDEQRAFADAEDIPFPLLSDMSLEAVAALRLPTFRAADTIRVKRVVLVLDNDRTVAAVRHPVTDIEAAVDWALATATVHRPQLRLSA